MTRLLRRIFVWLTMLRTAVVLLGVFAALTALGSLLPQGLPAASYLTRYGQAGGGAILALGFDHVFSSPAYTAVALALACAIIACFANRARALLQRIGRLPVLGSLALHAGLVIVLIGFLVTGWRAAETEIWLRPGQSGEALGIGIELSDFEIQYYSDLTPRQYLSRGSVFTVAAGGDAQEKQTFELMVNHPVRYSGALIYQYAFRWAVSLRLLGADGTEHKVRVGQGDSVTWPGTHLYVALTSFEQYAGQYPLATLLVHDGQQPLGAWQASPGERRQLAGLWLEIDGWQPETGLLIKRDPGVQFVALGGVLMLGGIVVRLLAPGRPGIRPKAQGVEESGCS